MKRCEDCGDFRHSETYVILADGVIVGEHDLCKDCAARVPIVADRK